MDAAPPFGLRLRSMVASLPLRGPRAPVWTRLRPSGFACGAWALRARSTGREARGYALRVSAAEHAIVRGVMQSFLSRVGLLVALVACLGSGCGDAPPSTPVR